MNIDSLFRAVWTSCRESEAAHLITVGVGLIKNQEGELRGELCPSFSASLSGPALWEAPDTVFQSGLPP